MISLSFLASTLKTVIQEQVQLASAQPPASTSSELVLHQQQKQALALFHQQQHQNEPPPMTMTRVEPTFSGHLVRHQIHQTPKPKWHAPWKLMRVISGHLGWVRAVAVDVSNEWFATGAGDRMIKACVLI